MSRFYNRGEMVFDVIYRTNPSYRMLVNYDQDHVDDYYYYQRERRPTKQLPPPANEPLDQAIQQLATLNIQATTDAIAALLPVSMPKSGAARKQLTALAQLQLQVVQNLRALQADITQEEIAMQAKRVAETKKADEVRTVSPPSSSSASSSSSSSTPSTSAASFGPTAQPESKDTEEAQLMVAATMHSPQKSSAVSSSSSSGPAPSPVLAEDHHLSLEWTDDVPATQMQHAWDDHRTRFPECNACRR